MTTYNVIYLQNIQFSNGFGIPAPTVDVSRFQVSCIQIVTFLLFEIESEDKVLCRKLYICVALLPFILAASA